MALTKCPDCDSDVSTEAPTCPKCGRPNAHPKKKASVLQTGCGAIVLGALVIVLAIALDNLGEPPTGNGTTEPTAAADTTAPVATLTPAAARAQVPSEDSTRAKRHFGAATHQPSVNLSKPVFTRSNAIICPIQSFLNVLAGHSYHDMMRMFDDRDPEGRELDAEQQDCEMYQPGVAFAVMSSADRKDAAQEAERYAIPNIARFLRATNLVILEDFGDDPAVPYSECCLVTRRDQLKN